MIRSLGAWRSRQVLGRALELPIRALPVSRPGSINRVLQLLADVCPARDVRLMRAFRHAGGMELLIRIELERWTWLGLGLVHLATCRTLERHRALWAPPGWRIELIVH